MRKRTLAQSATSPSTQELLRELVAHLQQNRTLLREEWARRITEAKLLTAMSKDEIFANRDEANTTGGQEGDSSGGA